MSAPLVRRAAVAAVVFAAVVGATVAYHPPRSTAPTADTTTSAACTRSGYSRAKFGNHPSSADRAAIVTLAAAPDGTIIDPYTGLSYPSTAGMDLDHIVPLGWAWDAGACRWPMQLRLMLAVDPHNLVFTAASLNRAKGDQGPDKWLPPTDPDGYRARFCRLAADYRLTAGAACPKVTP